MTQRQIETLNQAGANRQPQFRQALGTAAHPIHKLLQTPLALLFDHLSIDQLRVRFFNPLLGPTSLSRRRKCFERMVGLNESRQITTEPITEKTVMSCDYPCPPRIGLRSQSRVDQMRSVSPEAIAGVR